MTRAARLLLLLLLPVFLISQDKPTLAVLEFEGAGISESEVIALSNRLRTNMTQLGVYQVIERGQMQQILQEQDFQLTGCTTDECAVEIGQLLGAQLMLAGSIGKVGNTWTVEMRVIDVETGAVMRSASYDTRGEIDQVLTEGMGAAAKRIAEATAPIELGQLSIISNPTGASIYWINEEKDLGEAPVELNLSGGEHTFRLTKPEYKDTVWTVIIEPGTSEELLVDLLSEYAQVSIISEPPGASISIDEQPSGNTPIVVDLSEGEHAFTFKLFGYEGKSISRNLQLGFNDDIVVNLGRVYGGLVLITEPSEAELYYQDSLLGVTPIELPSQPIGKTTLRITKEKYIPRIIDVVVEENTVTTITEALEKKKGELVVTANVRSIELSLDGESSKHVRTPIKYSLPWGEYRVTATAENHRPYYETVLVEADQTTELPITFIKSTGFIAFSGLPTGTQITVNDTLRLVAPVSRKEMYIGQYTVQLTAGGYKPVKLPVFRLAEDQVYNIDANLFKAISPGKAMARSLIIPGWGQMYGERKLQGVQHLLLNAGLFYGSAYFNMETNDAINTYTAAKSKYSESTTSVKATALEMEQTYLSVLENRSNRNLILTLAGIWYAGTIIDAGYVAGSPVSRSSAAVRTRAVIASALCPGNGQYQLGSVKKGTVWRWLSLAAAAGVYSANNDYYDKYAVYLTAKYQYETASDDMDMYRANMQAGYKALQTASGVRTASYATLGCIWFANILDAAIFTKIEQIEQRANNRNAIDLGLVWQSGVPSFGMIYTW